MKANKRIKALMALTLLGLASCGDSSEEGKATDAAPAAESAPAQEAQLAAPAESAASEQAADGDTAAASAEKVATENATGALPPVFAQDGSLDASGSASEGVAPVISDDFLVPEADPELDLEGLGDSPEAPATPDAPATLP